jgi:hypothetical protein
MRTPDALTMYYSAQRLLAKGGLSALAEYAACYDMKWRQCWSCRQPTVVARWYGEDWCVRCSENADGTQGATHHPIPQRTMIPSTTTEGA